MHAKGGKGRHRSNGLDLHPGRPTSIGKRRWPHDEHHRPGRDSPRKLLHPQADRVIIIMGSGAGAVQETVDYLNRLGEKVGCLQVHLYRPFSMRHFINALPRSILMFSPVEST